MLMMSTPLPRLEARVGAQERLTSYLHARIEEMSQDMTIGFKQQTEYQAAMERRLDARANEISRQLSESFDQLAQYQIAMENELDARFTKIESQMATKEDIAALESRMATAMAAMESRMLDAFQQLVTVINTRLPAQQ